MVEILVTISCTPTCLNIETITCPQRKSRNLQGSTPPQPSLHAQSWYPSGSYKTALLKVLPPKPQPPQLARPLRIQPAQPVLVILSSYTRSPLLSDKQAQSLPLGVPDPPDAAGYGAVDLAQAVAALCVDHDVGAQLERADAAGVDGGLSGGRGGVFAGVHVAVADALVGDWLCSAGGGVETSENF